MVDNQGKKSLIIILSVLTAIISLTYLLSMFARGYQPDFANGFRLKATGILSATSKPKSASVYINQQLTTVTDATINLTPGNYHVTIKKDGYLPWEKNYQIEKELVYLTEAQLFKKDPILISTTIQNYSKIQVSPDKTKIILIDKSGLYLLENNLQILNLSKNLPKLIFSSNSQIDWAQFEFTFSPNSKQLLAKNKKRNIVYLINLDSISSSNNLNDISEAEKEIITKWQQEELIINNNIQKQIPQILKDKISTKSGDIIFSDNDEHILYLSQNQSTLLQNPSINQNRNHFNQETRNLNQNNYYVYDPLQDKNYLIDNFSLIHKPFWLPNTNFLIYYLNNDIFSIESDASNRQKLFSSIDPIIDLYPSPEGNKIYIISRLASDSAQLQINQITIK